MTQAVAHILEEAEQLSVQEREQLADRPIGLLTDGSPITNITEFDTMERYRTDSDKNVWYLRLPPQPSKPYPVEMSTKKPGSVS